MLVLFVEGDGTPWDDEGARIASNPTPRVPLALKLAAETPGSVLYLGRPCYFEGEPPPPCTPSLWTSERYSSAVVSSMVAAADAFASAHGISRVLLVGYSGGGTVAALMAPRMRSVAGVVTIAANLDTEAWVKWHGYLPLTGSLNPFLQPPLPAGLPEWHLVGGRDVNVPYSTVQRYFERVPPASILRYPTYDHVCCWEALWPTLLQQLPIAAESGP
jgi:pimeloyl-ACP methyl ester carboxylesterase